MNRQRRAEALLALATLIWGVSYYLSRVCFAELEPMTLNAFRFLSAFAVLTPLYHSHLRGISRETLRCGVLVGLVLVVIYIGATVGIKYTSLSNAGFISCLAVVFTPLLEFLFFGKRPGRQMAAALALCTVGLALLTLSDGLGGFAMGDALCLLCSLGYGVDIILTDRFMARPKVDPIGMCVVEMGITGIVFLLLSAWFEHPRLPHAPEVWAAALFLGVFCSGVTFAIQNTQQRYTTAARAALIFTLEPLFSAIIAYVFAGERLRLRAYLGAALMFLSLLLMQADLGVKKHDDIREGV